MIRTKFKDSRTTKIVANGFVLKTNKDGFHICPFCNVKARDTYTASELAYARSLL